MYLDCDTTPPLKSGYTMAKKLESSIAAAMAKMAKAIEGQIGIFDRYSGGQF